MQTSTRYWKPDSAQDAVRLARRQPGRHRYLAGGTSITTSTSDSAPESWIDLSAAGLGGFSVDGDGHRLGATLGLEEVASDSRIRLLGAGTLAQGAMRTRTEIWRRQATLAGHLLEQDPGDLIATVLLVCDAEVEVLEDPEVAASRISLERVLGSGLPSREALVTAVRLRPESGRPGFGFEMVARNALDRALAAVAVRLQVEDGRVRAARIATCGLPRPHRARHAEAALAGRSADTVAWAAAQAALDDDIQPESDHRASATYRGHVARVLLGRALRHAADGARKGASRAPSV